MKQIKKWPLFALLIMPTSLYSQNQRHMIFPRDLEEYAQKAKESNYDCFIAYENGDTLKGEVLKVTYNFKGDAKMSLDGKEISSKRKYEIISFQTESGFYSTAYIQENGGESKIKIFFTAARIMKGKIEMFCGTKSTGTGSTRVFRFRKESECCSKQVGPASIGGMVADNPEAAKKFKELFPKGDGNMNADYKKVIKVLEIYNKED